MVKYSIIIPVYNEDKTITPLCRQIKEVMDKIACENYEIIFIDDGSTDRSLDNLKKISKEIGETVALSLDKNYGQSCAIQAGLDISCGEIIIILDGDLQNDPQDIPKLLHKIEEGYDVVCGWSKNKHTKWHKAWASYMANYLRRFILQEKIHDVGCMFRAYTRNSLKGINLDGCKHRFITGILAKKGVKICEVEINAYPRVFGVSKYGVLDRFIKSIPEIFRIYLTKSSGYSQRRKYIIKEIIRNDDKPLPAGVKSI